MIRRIDLDHAAAAGIISPDQAAQLAAFLEGGSSKRPDDATARFTFTHVLYYLGGLIAIGALSLFMTLAWERLGFAAVLATVIAYGAAAYLAAAAFERRGYLAPAGILATIVVVLMPLGIFALQHLMGFWPEGKSPSYRDYHYLIDWRWIVMEIATLVGGAVMLWRFRHPFLTMPIAVTLWYVGMDLVPLLAGGSTQWTSEYATFRKMISIAFGLAMLGFALIVDLRSRFSRDYAFWLYLFGLATFWGGLSMLGSNALSGKLVYLAINVLLILIGVVLLRRVFAVFGGIGVAMVLGDISYRYFKDSFAFTIVLTLIGLAIIGAGIWWQRNESRLSRRLRHMLPADLREMLEARRATA